MNSFKKHFICPFYFILASIFLPKICGATDENSIVEDYLKSINYDISNIISDDSKYENHWNKILKKLPNDLLDEEYSDEVLSGVEVPRFFKHLRKLDVSSYTQWKNNEDQNVSTQLAYLSFRRLDSKTADPLIVLNSALAFKNSLPPTKRDVMIYLALYESLGALSKNQNGVSLDVWQKFAEAKNPIYRILAIRGVAVSFVPEILKKYNNFRNSPITSEYNMTYWLAKDKLSFYEQFVDEFDREVLIELLRSIDRSAVHPDSIEILKYLKQRNISQIDEDLELEIDYLLRRFNEIFNNPEYAQIMAKNPLEQDIEKVVEVEVVETLEPAKDASKTEIKKEEPAQIEKVKETVIEQEEKKSPMILYVIGIVAFLGIFLVTRKKKND